MEIGKILVSKFVGIISVVIPCRKVISFCSYPDYTDNPYAVFKKMYSDQRFKRYTKVWLISDKSKLLQIRNLIQKDFPTVRVEAKSSVKGLYILLISRFHICSHGLQNTMYFHQKKPKVINLWHGMPLKVIGALDSVYGTTYSNSDILIATNNFYSYIMAKSLEVPLKNVYIIGYPRNDLFLEKTNFFNLYGLRQNDFTSVGAWLPTFHKNADGEDRTDGVYEEGKIEFLDIADLRNLDKFLKRERRLLVIKLHPMDAANDFDFPSFSNLIIVNKRSPRFQLYPFLGKCDYLLTDFSSVFIDFDILRRPIGFVFSNLEKYKNSRGFIVDDVESFLPGNFIKNKEELVEFIDHFHERYIETGERYNKYKDFQSTERLLHLLNEKL